MFTIIKNYVVNYSNLDKISQYFINGFVILVFTKIRGFKKRLRKKPRYFILLFNTFNNVLVFQIIIKFVKSNVSYQYNSIIWKPILSILIKSKEATLFELCKKFLCCI